MDEKKWKCLTGAPSKYIQVVALTTGIIICYTNSAEATCVVPNALTNGQVANATQVMGNFDAVTNCINAPPPTPTTKLSGPGGGVVTLQNPSATANYNFNFPATAGSAGNLLTSGGGGSNPTTWTSTGTTGHVLPYLDGSNSWSGTQIFGSVVGSISTQSGTTYTLAQSDCGTTIRFTNSSPITLTTLNSLPAGCAIAIEQSGSGHVTVQPGSGTTQHSTHGFTKTFAQYAILGLFVDTNTGGSAANFIVSGDGA